MATVTVSLPDDVVDRLAKRLAPHGYTVEQFVSSSLAEFADSGELISPALEAKLLASLDTDLLEADEVNWEAKLQRLRSANRGKTQE